MTRFDIIVVGGSSAGCALAGRLTDDPCGSCRMGPGEPADSVVDPRLRLIGIDNVRVADAAVILEIIAGNTNAAAMMIGEAAAGFIAGDLCA